VELHIGKYIIDARKTVADCLLTSSEQIKVSIFFTQHSQIRAIQQK
jgi:hypothetical protein